MNDLCPICKVPIRTFYRIHDQLVIAYCSSVHTQNMTQTKHLYFEGTGDSTAKAKEKFVWEAMRKMGAKR